MVGVELSNVDVFDSSDVDKTSADHAFQGGAKIFKSFWSVLEGRKPAGTLRFNCLFVFTPE